MSYPFDQWTTVAGANRDLLLKYAEIMRHAGERQASIATHTLAILSPKNGEQAQPVQAPNFSGFSEIWQEIEQNRQATMEETRAAFKAWQADVGHCFEADAGRQQLAAAFETWTSSLSKLWPGAAAGEKGKAEKKPAS